MTRKKANKVIPVASKPSGKDPQRDIYHNFHFSDIDFHQNSVLFEKAKDLLRVCAHFLFQKFESVPKEGGNFEKKLMTQKFWLDAPMLKKDLQVFNRIKYGNHKSKFFQID